MQDILLSIESKERRFAHLKNGQLHDLIIERKTSRPIAGNIYRGRVTSILHNIQSAFIDIGEEENGFIHISDLMENIQKFQEMYEMDFDMDTSKQKGGGKQEADITKLLKIDQPVLVEVVKEPIGTKGARLTSNVSIAGRFLVLLPNTPHRAVSRRIEDSGARERLRKLITAFEMPQEMGIICRTSSANATPEVLIQEAHDLVKTWQSIMEKFQSATGSVCLYEESDLLKRAVISAIDKRMDRLLIDDYATYQHCKEMYDKYATEHQLKVEYYRDKTPMFERFNVEREIERALRRKIWLPGGGYLYFDQTEAMVTIDVNSGRSSQSSGGDVEEAIVRINLEGADEIARQLRLRNVGGLVVIDFIDMRQRKNQKRILERLKEAMREDTAKCTILGMSEFGLIEMTRQRSRQSLSQMIFDHCPYCSGSGEIKSLESTVIEIERVLKKLVLIQEQYGLKLVSHPQLDKFLGGQDKKRLAALAEKWHAKLEFGHDDTLHLNDYQFYSTLSGKQITS